MRCLIVVLQTLAGLFAIGFVIIVLALLGQTIGASIPPTQAPSVVEGHNATARCEDGAWSYSIYRSGTCSGHGGVDYWVQ